MPLQLAEDNATNQRIVYQVLKKHVETPIVVAVNGLEAVEAVKAQHFDVCLMDVQARTLCPCPAPPPPVCCHLLHVACTVHRG